MCVWFAQWSQLSLHVELTMLQVVFDRENFQLGWLVICQGKVFTAVAMPISYDRATFTSTYICYFCSSAWILPKVWKIKF